MWKLIEVDPFLAILECSRLVEYNTSAPEERVEVIDPAMDHEQFIFAAKEDKHESRRNIQIIQ